MATLAKIAMKRRASAQGNDGQKSKKAKRKGSSRKKQLKGMRKEVEHDDDESEDDDDDEEEEEQEEEEAEEGVLGGHELQDESSRLASSVRAASGQGGRSKFRREKYINKQRCLVMCSRGAGASYRHLVDDIKRLLPHHKRDVKLDSKKDLRTINEIAEMKSCNTSLFFEFRKRQDVYMWMSATPAGPSVKCLMQNVHTMEELRLTGNCLMGSRPILSFDAAFDGAPHLRVIKELFSQIFGTPRGHPKSKPFIDHVITFSFLDGNIWFRNFQLVDQTLDEKAIRRDVRRQVANNKLIEIGPRFVLSPIRIFSGSFGGPTIYTNPRYVSPNETRRDHKARKGDRYAQRLAARQERSMREASMVLPKDHVEGVWRE